MVDYKKGKVRYIYNNLGSLYLDKSKLNNNERPIIYIGGQMEHRCHRLEQYGKTFDPGHNMFTGSWFYDYPNNLADKSIVNSTNFAENLEACLKAANLSDVDFITHSFGGNIAAMASKNNRIHKIYAIHPPIIGTPLASPSYLKNFKEAFTTKEKLVMQLLKIVIDESYGFEKDNFNGIDLKKVDLNKLVVIGSAIDPKQQKGLILELYNIIKKVNGLENDSVVIFDEQKFNELGINYVVEDGFYSHFNSGTKEAFENALTLSRKR